MINKDYFKKQAELIQVELTAQMLEQFDIYAEFLVEYNKKVNLTRITEPEDIVNKHYLDSLTLLKNFRPIEGCKLIDVGAGAGFPSIPLKLVRDDLKLTLLDSTRKKVVFLELLCERLGIKCKFLSLRAEEAGKNPAYREKFDLAVARAVASMTELTEYCLPLVKTDGIFAAYKGDSDNEMRDAEQHISLLGGAIGEIYKTALPDGDKKTIILIKKISQTPTAYPRNSAKIKKKVL